MKNFIIYCAVYTAIWALTCVVLHFGFSLFDIDTFTVSWAHWTLIIVCAIASSLFADRIIARLRKRFRTKDL